MIDDADAATLVASLLVAMAESILLTEYDHDPSHSDPPFREYVISGQANGVSVTRIGRGSAQQATQGSSARDFLKVPRQVCKDLFLPVGYPQSVRPEYMSYQIYDSLQGLCSYLRGVVSTSALLTAAGVGDSEATAMSAAMTWAMRDGLGMVGGLIFSYSTSSLFDSYVKEFRLFADVINDVGLTLDMVAPYVGTDRVLYVTSMGTIAKVMCGIAAGATKGSITQHFCLRGNMADLNAKEGTQETLVSLVGMLLGIALARYLHDLEQKDVSLTATVSWTIFVVLTLVHVWANYVGVKLLRLRTLNRERATVAFEGAVESLAANSTSTHSAGTGSVKETLTSIPTPEQVSESLWASMCTLLLPDTIRLGVQAKCVMDEIGAQDFTNVLMNEFSDERYLVSVANGRRISVALRVGATDADELKAFVHALTIHKCIEQESLMKHNDDFSELISRFVRLLRLTSAVFRQDRLLTCLLRCRLLAGLIPR